MEKGQFDYIYRNLPEIETQILELYLSNKDITQQEIAKSVNCDQSNVGRKLKAIAKKFNYSESSLDYQEYLVKIFSQY
ncbi:MAG: hypothetical protein F6K17_10275, partial [Okeania sp. SIO3C4]|nr:hypothetical protein [Okeania sp. SIO3C4]